MDKLDIKSQTKDKLENFFEEIGEKKFRAAQAYDWLHKKNALDFGMMTTFSNELRAKLEHKCQINDIKIKKKLVSSIDGTVKYLYGLFDGNCVETVLMRYKHGNSCCVSTQAGCRMGCGFCASTIGGLVRNLTASEILDQIYETTRDSGEKISNVVLMGIGEPLDNFDNVLDFLTILSSPEGLNLSLRHVSLSTCGLVEQIDELARKKMGLTLSVSLHAPNDEIRSRIMPVNRKWGVDELIAACRRYAEETRRRISFEYALIKDLNDGESHARQLAARLKRINCHVNLIPVNEVRESGYSASGAQRVADFQKILTDSGINATVRRKLGGDVNAACGQLRRE